MRSHRAGRYLCAGMSANCGSLAVCADAAARQDPADFDDRTPVNGESMQRNPYELAEKLRERFGADLRDVSLAFGEVTAVVPLSAYREVMLALRDDPAWRFEELIDLCGLDYAGYGNFEKGPAGKRFAVAVHLLSLTFNCRLRVRVFAENEEMPEVPSVSDISPSAKQVRTGSVRSVRYSFFRASRFAAHSDGLRFCRTSVPKGFSGTGLCRDAL